MLFTLGAMSAAPALAGVFNPDVNGTGLTVAEYMIPVPGGGQPGGPAYTYHAGKYEITNRQLVDFLNDAELDANSGSPTRRSSNMHFASSGIVCMDPSLSTLERLTWVCSTSPDFDITYDPGEPVGSRYGVKPGLDGHPARYLSWMGALKFCNWLTVDQGLGEEHCCYSEGPDIGDWHSVTISTENWWGKEPAHNDRVSAGRDLNDDERAELVRRHRGYRLPMDDAGMGAPNNRPYPDDFNEWLKAAAYDPNAPDTIRTNAGGWQAMPHHWMYAFGRETNTPADANWRLSGDPYDDGTTPVDYYDGTDHGGTFPTNDTNNRYGFYGMSGNVWEWGNDYGVSPENRAIYGGSWVSTPQRQATSSCYLYGRVNLPDTSFGFRILCVAGPVEVKLTASDPAASDEFGRTVCISGTYAISGAHFDDEAGANSGSAYVSKREGINWIAEAKLTASDGAAGDHFGHVVGISGDLALVGAPYDDDDGDKSGSAYVFKRNGTGWTQDNKLTAPDAAAEDYFGYSVAISGDNALIGAYADDDDGSMSGSAYLFKRSGAGWTQDAKLTASDAAPTDYFGYSVSIDGDLVLIGAYGDDDHALDSGSAYVFRRDGASWIEEAKLTAPDAAATDGFGLAVCISGDHAVVGAPWDDDAGGFSGSAYVFRRNGTSWIAEAKLIASDAAADDLFGHSVSISGDCAVIGAFGDDDAGGNSGSAYVFQRDGTNWTEKVKIIPSDAAGGDQFGQAVSISSGLALVGSPYDSDGGHHSGSAYVYELDRPCTPGDTITVCWDGSGDHSTIQAGIDAAVDRDEVLVCPGTYTGPDNRDLDFAGKAITVRSTGGPATTIIDCQGAGRGFHFHSGEGPASVVEGFTITNGSADNGGGISCEGSSPTITDCHLTGSTADFGGGISCDGASPTIMNCRVSGNSVGGGGGGISCWNDSNPTITDCSFRGNVAVSGGGVRCYESSPLITNCTISGNRGNTAGGIYCNRSTATVTNCRISGNFARGAGGIYCYLHSPTITNCRITGNSTDGSGGGIYCSTNSPAITNCAITGNAAATTGGGIRCYNGSPTFTNCTTSGNSAGSGGGIHCEDASPAFTNGILWDNSPDQVYAASASPELSYSDVQGGWPGVGNIDADPLFADGSTGSWTSDGAYDPATYEVTFTDDAAAWAQGELVDKRVNPDTTRSLQFLIVANTASTITILADSETVDAGASWVASGASYAIHDDHLGGASPCVNAGRNSMLPQDTCDLDGDGDTNEPTPFDLDGNPRVRGCVADMGVCEFQTPAPADIPGDFDDDCDVDADDLPVFEACGSGPAIPQNDLNCGDAKLDEDDDVDQSDFGLFQRCISGPDVPGDPDCAD